MQQGLSEEKKRSSAAIGHIAFIDKSHCLLAFQSDEKKVSVFYENQSSAPIDNVTAVDFSTPTPLFAYANGEVHIATPESLQAYFILPAFEGKPIDFVAAFPTAIVAIAQK